MILHVEYLYWLAGAVLLLVAAGALADPGHPRRYGSAAFWGLFGMLFLAGDWLPAQLSGAIVLAMVLLAGLGRLGSGHHIALSAARLQDSLRRLGGKVFLPSLLVPLLTVALSLAAKDVKLAGAPLFDPKNVTLLALGVACLVSFIAACGLTRERPAQSIRETRRLLDCMGWAVLLPQMLAVLGLLFADAGAGKAVAHVATAYLSLDTRWVAVLAYVLGMALFTMIMGNAFAAFPVMTAGIGIPFLVGMHHGDAAVMAAIGMFSGYCGTLMTPMAANFNIVPAALLELDDKNAVIKAQVPTALALLAVNAALMNWLMFR
ncbi:DUF979 family protein [Chromobacterium subtsugae]|uniref:DUF979 family protein n=1 Tax=Chromobacterium subtsugae TaxID=251747 RepID=A0ABS7FH56_9NEIS|nr:MULTISPECIES: DUF979 domain-containing protein [Chromobacterium]KUM01628.1 permease [Chromobacterium subtsugae]KZE87279.1 permease [Chromobacterium sp. F49]MBW7568324.1 DUF979 domain-containing protein [Chromobacterium subtsugae]MBW8289412.1 DUF979 family protein [Chromobacterium subtsugae]OBU88062.1 permease [Chromobacterium subtsugae]